MDSWLVALIAAAGAIAGSGLTGLITYRLALLQRDSAAKAELRSALAAYGAALDRLTMQIEQLPQAHGIEEDWTTSTIAKFRTLDWLMGRVSTATIGRGAMRALDDVITATNRLILVAPESVLEAMQRVSELIGGFAPASVGWKDEWRAARAGISGASREALDS